MLPLRGTSFCCSSPPPQHTHVLLSSLEWPFYRKLTFHPRAQLSWGGVNPESERRCVASLFIAFKILISRPGSAGHVGLLPSDRTSPSISVAFSPPQNKRLIVFFCFLLHFCLVHMPSRTCRSENNLQESVFFRSWGS